jgi:hypothetical protein
MQTNHDALTQYLEALSRRLDELAAADKNPHPRPSTRRRPTP